MIIKMLFRTIQKRNHTHTHIFFPWNIPILDVSHFYGTNQRKSFEFHQLVATFPGLGVPQLPTSGGGGVDPVDVPAVLEIFSTSADGRWFVGLVVKQVAGGWLKIREGQGFGFL